MTNNVFDNWDGICYHSIKHGDKLSKDVYKEIKEDGYLRITNISKNELIYKFENPVPNIKNHFNHDLSFLENIKYLHEKYKYTEDQINSYFNFERNINDQQIKINKYELYKNIPNYLLINEPLSYQNKDFKRTFLAENNIILKLNLLKFKGKIKPDIDWFKFQKSKNFPNNNLNINIYIKKINSDLEFSNRLITESGAFCINENISCENIISVYILKKGTLREYDE